MRWAVSYTHLDVYKRQIEGREGQMGAAAKEEAEAEADAEEAGDINVEE